MRRAVANFLAEFASFSHFAFNECGLGFLCSKGPLSIGLSWYNKLPGIQLMAARMAAQEGGRSGHAVAVRARA